MTNSIDGPKLMPADVPETQIVIGRFCKLVEEVSNNVFEFSGPTDCFCGGGGYWPLRRQDQYHHDPETTVAFIERATMKAIKEFRELVKEHESTKPDPMLFNSDVPD